MMKSFALVVAGALVGAATLGVLQPSARAQSAVTSAYFGGLQSQPSFAPRIFVFNTTAATQTLDLVLRAPDGTVLVTHPAAMTVAAYATAVLDLTAELAHAGPKSKAYRGVFTAVLSGDSSTFSDTTCVVHAVQYFGSIKSPHGACVIRPLMTTPI
jgi:F0F1-type ATP synthase membrane subunit c/vacuolar-type H+-ATPase subunit K